MKLSTKLKAIAAVAAMAGTTSAFASFTDGDVILNVWDSTALTSFSFDTGINANTAAAFNALYGAPGVYTIGSFAGNAQWNSFEASINTGDSVLYNVFAGDNGGASSTFTLLSTTNAASYSALKNATGKVVNNDWDQLVGNLNTYDTTSTSGNTTSGFGSSSSNGAASYAGAFGGNGGTVSDTVNNAAVPGTSLNFFSITNNGTSGTAPVSNSQFVNANNVPSYWSLNGNTLTYTVAAVPEPQSWVMLMAGGLMVVTMARRRRNWMV